VVSNCERGKRKVGVVDFMLIARALGVSRRSYCGGWGEQTLGLSRNWAHAHPNVDATSFRPP